MRVRTGATAAALALGMTLSGCGGEQEQPSTLPTLADRATTAPPVPPPSPTPSGSAEPTPADVEAELEAFFREFARLRDESYSSREALEESRNYFADTCRSCVAGYEIAEEIHDNGYAVRTAPAIIRRFEVDEIDGDSARYRVVLDIAGLTMTDDDGRVVEEYDSFDGRTFLYTVRRQESGNWLIVDDTVLE